MDPQAQPTTSAPAQTALPQSAPTVRYSGLLRRLIAVAIDQFIILIVFFVIPTIALLVLGMRSENIPESADLLMRLFVGGMYIAYGTFFEARTGQTLGKKILGIKVVQDNGQPCDLKSALLRNVAKIIDGILGIFVLLIIILTPKKQRIGDMLAKTIVVKT